MSKKKWTMELEPTNDPIYPWVFGDGEGITGRVDSHRGASTICRYGNTHADLVANLTDLAHLADTLNARQHAGMPITPAMWSALYQRTNEARATLAKAAAAAHDRSDLIAALKECITENGAHCFSRRESMAQRLDAMAKRIAAINEVVRAALAKAEGED